MAFLFFIFFFAFFLWIPFKLVCLSSTWIVLPLYYTHTEHTQCLCKPSIVHCHFEEEEEKMNRKQYPSPRCRCRRRFPAGQLPSSSPGFIHFQIKQIELIVFKVNRGNWNCLSVEEDENDLQPIGIQSIARNANKVFPIQIYENRRDFRFVESSPFTKTNKKIRSFH